MSDTRLEYHEIREVFERYNERMNPKVAAELADLSLAKYQKAHWEGRKKQEELHGYLQTVRDRR